MTTVSVNAEDLALVIGLACLTADRGSDEQRALLHVAERCDKVRNAQVRSNVAVPGEPPGTRMWLQVGLGLERIGEESALEREAHVTRRLEDGERPIKPSWERKAK